MERVRAIRNIIEYGLSNYMEKDAIVDFLRENGVPEDLVRSTWAVLLKSNADFFAVHQTRLRLKRQLDSFNKLAFLYTEEISAKGHVVTYEPLPEDGGGATPMSVDQVLPSSSTALTISSPQPHPSHLGWVAPSSPTMEREGGAEFFYSSALVPHGTMRELDGRSSEQRTWDPSEDGPYNV